MPITKVTLSRGSEGVGVAYLQTLLNLLEYHTTGIDGIFSLATEHAVKTFQSDNGLVIDGIVGDETWESLNREIQRRITQQTKWLPWWAWSMIGGVAGIVVVKVASYIVKRK